MKYREQIPQDLFENPYVDQMVTVMDGTELQKSLIVEKSTRFYRSVVNCDMISLRKRVEDLNFPPVPHDFPKDILDALILNAAEINRLKGSPKGLELWLWCLTFGSLSIGLSGMYPISNYIKLNDVTEGFLGNTNPPQSKTLYLFSGYQNFGSQTVTIAIQTKYHYLIALRTYILQNIRKYLSFTDNNITLNITYTPGTYVTNSNPNQYFVIP